MPESTKINSDQLKDEYALASHNHDLAYAAAGHNHDLAYAAAGSGVSLGLVIALT